MCGIVGAIGQRDVNGILVEGLKRLEYRGYDSAGLAIINRKSLELSCIKTVGKVQALEDKLKESAVDGPIGIAHTRLGSRKTHTGKCSSAYQRQSGRPNS